MASKESSSGSQSSSSLSQVSTGAGGRTERRLITGRAGVAMVDEAEAGGGWMERIG
jgi:hypothetical protein